MAIKRNSCRRSERQRMKNLEAEGYSIPQISNLLSVQENVVEYVLSGKWDKEQAKVDAEQKRRDEAREIAALEEKKAEAAAMGTAIADALKQSGVVSPSQQGIAPQE